MLNLGFIGAGNMGGALALAAAKKEGNSIFLSDKIQEKAEALAEKPEAPPFQTKKLPKRRTIFFSA